jgi:four helix bundle protein
MQCYSQIGAFREAHALALSVHQATAQFLPDEPHGLTAQLRRAALTVPMRIVEGSKRSGDGFRRALDSAEASLAETEYLLIACRDLGYIHAAVTDPLIRTAPRIAQRLVTLRSFATDITALQKAMPDVSELGDILLESSLDAYESSLAPADESAPARGPRSRKAQAGKTDRDLDGRSGKRGAVRASARARKACAARSRRSR